MNKYIIIILFKIIIVLLNYCNADSTLQEKLDDVYSTPYIDSYDAAYNTFTLYGNNFGVVYDNIVTLGDKNFTFSRESTYYSHQGTLYFIECYDSYIFTQLEEGLKYQLTVDSDGQLSNIFEFYYIASISIGSDRLRKLSLSGGQIRLESTFSYIPTDYSIITCKIDQPTTPSTTKNCTVNSIDQDSIIITYPKSTRYGDATITLNIGGRIVWIDLFYDYNSVSNSTSNLNNINFIILISLLFITIISTISTSTTNIFN